MEGYLTLITKSYALPKYRKVWVVLDRQQLTWYDRLDPVDQLPKKLKGVLFVRDAKLMKVADKFSEHSLLITCDTSKTLFGCEDGTDCSNWYKALTKSLVYHTEAAARERLPKEYREVLGFEAEETLSKAVLSRTYKRLCLKEHPDKGGNIEAFNKIKEAYNYLNNLQTYLDETENTVPVQYEVTIRKKAGKVGLGMTVTEDKIHQRLLVGKVNSEIDIVHISEESGGSIQSGDRLIGIDSDDCSLWITNRLLARLGPVRIPIHGKVVFTLERRVAPDEYDSDGGSDNGSDVYESAKYTNTPTPSPVPTTIFQSNGTSSTPNTTNNNNNTSTLHLNTNQNSSRDDVYSSNSTIDTPVNMHASGNITPISPHPTTFTTAVHPSVTTNREGSTETKKDEPGTPLSPAEARAAALERRRLKLAEVERQSSESSAPVVLMMPMGVGSDGSSNTIHTGSVAPVVVPTTTPTYTAHTTHISTSSSASTTTHTAHTIHTIPAEHTTYTTYTPLSTQLSSSDDQYSYLDERCPSPPPPPPPPPFTTSMLLQQHQQHNNNQHSLPVRPLAQQDVQYTDSGVQSQNSVQLHEEYAQQRDQLQAQLQQAVLTVRTQSECIEHLRAENESLKDAVASLARFMERKHLEDPSQRTQDILHLHKELLESKVQIKSLEQALARATGVNNISGGGGSAAHGLNESDVLQQAIRSEQTLQAQRVENMVQSAILHSRWNML